MPIPITGTGTGTITSASGGPGASAILSTAQDNVLREFLTQEQDANERRRTMMTARYEDMASAPADGEVWFQDQPYFEDVSRAMLGRGVDLLRKGKNIYDEFSPDYAEFKAEKNRANAMRNYSIQHKGYYDKTREAFDPKVHDPKSMEALDAWAKLPFSERMMTTPPQLIRRGWEVDDEFFAPLVDATNDVVATAFNKRDYEMMQYHAEEAHRGIDQLTQDLLLAGDQDTDYVRLLAQRAHYSVDRAMYDTSKEQDLAIKRLRASTAARKLKIEEMSYAARQLALNGVAAGDPEYVAYLSGGKLAGSLVKTAKVVREPVQGGGLMAGGIDGSGGTTAPTYIELEVEVESENDLMAKLALLGGNATVTSGAGGKTKTIRIATDDPAAPALLNGIMNTSPSSGGKQFDYESLKTQGADEWVFNEVPLIKANLSYMIPVPGENRMAAANSYTLMATSDYLNEPGISDQVYMNRFLEIANSFFEQGMSAEQATQTTVELLNLNRQNLNSRELPANK